MIVSPSFPHVSPLFPLDRRAIFVNNIATFAPIHTLLCVIMQINAPLLSHSLLARMGPINDPFGLFPSHGG